MDTGPVVIATTIRIAEPNARHESLHQRLPVDFGRRMFICSNQNLNSSGTFGCGAIAHSTFLLVGLRSLTLKAAIIFSVIKVSGSARLPPPADTLSVKRSEFFRRADERFSHGNRCYKLFETQMSDRRAFDDGMPRRVNRSV